MKGLGALGLRRLLLAFLLAGMAAGGHPGPAVHGQEAAPVQAAAQAPAQMSATAMSAAALAQDAPDVEVAREHLFLRRGPAGLQVLQLLELVNLGPAPAGRVPLPVPEQAQWEQLPEPLEAADGAVVDPRPLGVGEGRQYALTYSIPWREPMVLRRALLYPTEELWIWAETGTLAVRGVRLEPVGRQEIEGIPFAVYRMQQLEPHDAWQVVLDRPGAASTELPVLMRAGMRSDPAEILATHPVPRLVLAALVLAAAVAGARRLRSRASDAPARSQAAGSGSGKGGTVPAQPAHLAEAERLKDEIVRLDVAFHQGELDEDVYRERRERLFARLVALSGNGGTGGRGG